MCLQSQTLAAQWVWRYQRVYRGKNLKITSFQEPIKFLSRAGIYGMEVGPVCACPEHHSLLTTAGKDEMEETG